MTAPRNSLVSSRRKMTLNPPSRHTSPNAMTRLAALFVALILVVARPATADAPRAALALFPSEIKAQEHCPGDAVVWLNLPTGIYHFKGERWYGRTKRGAFVCKKEADAAGDRELLNGR